ncbi:hypothetical protein PsorP6_014323 [Peronosclerospora sorghi]|uniref:Uncharacterized protein n=1 Tax=Peronosclerospora sorghi TaxID=230839 RepID=A0ACC0VHA7_9STRA|nr:hypothetical protein PsorP6_014323 [Peronosclerospora sorghi]
MGADGSSANGARREHVCRGKGQDVGAARRASRECATRAGPNSDGRGRLVAALCAWKGGGRDRVQVSRRGTDCTSYENAGKESGRAEAMVKGVEMELGDVREQLKASREAWTKAREERDEQERVWGCRNGEYC